MILALIEKISNIKLNVSSFLLTFSSIVIIRTFFEFILEPTHNFSFFSELYFSLVDYTHIYLSWLTLFFSIVLFLKYSYAVPLVTIVKVMLVAFPIIIVVPFVDFILPMGNFIRYEHDFENFFHIFSNIFFFYTDIDNLTLGVRTEITLVLVMVLIFGFAKQKKVYQILLSMIGVYSIIFLFMYMPAVLVAITGLDFHTLVETSLFPVKSYTHLYGLMYTPIIIILSSIGIVLLPQNWIKSLWYILRIERFTIYLGIMLGGIFLAVSNYTSFLNIFNFYDVFKILAAIFSLMLFFMFSTIINDIADEESDKITNKNRVLVQKLLNKDDFLGLAKVCFLFSFLFGILINEHFIFLLFALYSLSYLYSTPPFQLKKIIFLSHLMLTFIAAIVFLLGYCIVEANLGFQKVDVGLLYSIMFFFFVSSHLKDIKDAQSDKQYGVQTLANIFEPAKVLNCLNITIGLMVAICGSILGINILYVASVTAFFLLFAFIYKNSEKSIVLTQFAGFILLVLYIL